MPTGQGADPQGKPVGGEPGAGEPPESKVELVADAPQPGSPAVAAEAVKEGGEQSPPAAGEGPVDVQALVAQAVERATAELRAKYEGKDGDIARLKRSYERKLAELRRQQSLNAQQVVEEAMKLAESDPQRALEMLGAQLQRYQQRDMQAVQEAQMAEWTEQVAGEFGLDTADEEVAAIIEEVGPLSDPAASYELLGRLGKLATEREAKRAKSAEERLAEFERTLPEQVNRLVAAALAERTGPVETREPTAPPVQEEDLTRLGVGTLLNRGIKKFRANRKR